MFGDGLTGMKVSCTSKCDARFYKAFSNARRSVHLEIDELIRGTNEPLPDIELIFCPLLFTEAERHNWRDKTRRHKTENWVSFERWLPPEPFLPPALGARVAYSDWIRVTMTEAEIRYPDLGPARRLLLRLSK